MSDLCENHIVGFPTRRLICFVIVFILFCFIQIHSDYFAIDVTVVGGVVAQTDARPEQYINKGYADVQVT